MGERRISKKTYKKRWGRQPKSDWKLLRGRKSAKKLPTVMEGGEEVTKSDAGGTAKRWLGGGLAYALQLAKSDDIFMDFIWPSSNEINSSPPFLKVLWGPQVFRLVEVYICCTLQKRWTHLVHNHIISKHAWDKHQFGYQNWIANYKIWKKKKFPAVADPSSVTFT